MGVQYPTLKDKQPLIEGNQAILLGRSRHWMFSFMFYKNVLFDLQRMLFKAFNFLTKSVAHSLQSQVRSRLCGYPSPGLPGGVHFINFFG